MLRLFRCEPSTQPGGDVKSAVFGNSLPNVSVPPPAISANLSLVDRTDWLAEMVTLRLCVLFRMLVFTH
jgi:hypothetical protein